MSENKLLIALAECWDALDDAKKYLTNETPDQPMTDIELRNAILKQIESAIESAKSSFGELS